MSKTETQSEALRLAAAITASGQFTNLETLDSAAATLRRLDAENKALREMLGVLPAGVRRYHFVQRSKFGPWVEVEQQTEASTAFVKEADVAAQAAAKTGDAA